VAGAVDHNENSGGDPLGDPFHPSGAGLAVSIHHVAPAA
jgi:hypothetical protein